MPRKWKLAGVPITPVLYPASFGLATETLFSKEGPSGNRRSCYLAWPVGPRYLFSITFTCTGSDVVRLLAGSRATAVKVYSPNLNGVVSQFIE